MNLEEINRATNRLREQIAQAAEECMVHGQSPLTFQRLDRVKFDQRTEELLAEFEQTYWKAAGIPRPRLGKPKEGLSQLLS